MSDQANNPFTRLEIVPRTTDISLHRDEFEELTKKAKILADLSSEFDIVLRSEKRFNYIEVRHDLTRIGNATSRSKGVRIEYHMFQSVLQRLNLKALLLGSTQTQYQVSTPWQYQRRWLPLS